MRVAAWVGDRLPRVDATSDRVDWFFVWLVAGPCLMAAALMAIYLVDHVYHISILPLSVQQQRTLKGYAITHSLADRKLEIFGLIAAAYPALLWVLVRIATRGGRHGRGAKPQRAR